jgi:uncharacterized repeat protein (TIGR01451 family)
MPWTTSNDSGLEYSNIAFLDLDTGGDGERDDAWYNQDLPDSPAEDFASVLVEQQNADGSWPSTCMPTYNFPILCTTWALLILERVAPPNPFHLSITKTVTLETSVACHDTMTYTVVLHNDGKRDTPGTLLTDTLPSEVASGSWVVRPPGASDISDRITWSGTVTTGEAITFTFTALHVGACGETVTNTAEFEFPVGEGNATVTFTANPFYLYLPLMIQNDDDYAWRARF